MSLDLERLKDPFDADDVEWRVGQSGKTRDGRPWAKVLAYLTNRAIMDRLDEVAGPGGWENRFEKAPNDPKGESLLCGIGIRVEGVLVWKWDGANNTDVEPTKGGISDSMKRAAVQWGIGRYLYGIGESWADCTEESMKGKDGWRYAKTKDGTFWWKPPALPEWATPRPESRAEIERRKQVANDSTGGALKPASSLPVRGEGGGWDQWLTLPPKLRGSDAADVWHCQAVKGLLEEAGADTVGKVRALFWWLTGVRHAKPGDAIGDPVAAQVLWLKILQTREDLGLTLHDMLAEAVAGYAEAEQKAAAAKAAGQSAPAGTQRQLVDTAGYGG